MLEIKHFKTLLALEETGSLVGAANQLFLTQSALSHQLRDLEDRLACRLFVRKSQPIKFTRQGEYLLDLGRQLLPQIKQAEQTLKEINLERVEYKAEVECHSCVAWLLPEVKRFENLHPEFKLALQSSTETDALPLLKNHELDIVFTSENRAEKGIVFYPLFAFELVLAVSPEHALANREWVIPKDLAAETLLCYPVENQRIDLLTRFTQPHNVELNTRHVSQLMPMLQMTAAGVGVSAVPNWAAHEFQQQGLINTLSLGQEGVWLTLYAAVREPVSHALKEFIHFTQQGCLSRLKGVQPLNRVSAA